MTSWLAIVPVLLLAEASSTSAVVQERKVRTAVVEKCTPQVWFQEPDGSTECFVETPDGRMD